MIIFKFLSLYNYCDLSFNYFINCNSIDIKYDQHELGNYIEVFPKKGSASSKCIISQACLNYQLCLTQPCENDGICIDIENNNDNEYNDYYCQCINHYNGRKMYI